MMLEVGCGSGQHGDGSHTWLDETLAWPKALVNGEGVNTS
jgi:hypothetical protein